MLFSNLVIEIQPTLLISLALITCLCVFFVYAGKKIEASNPLEKPKGLVLVIEFIVDTFTNFFGSILPEKLQKHLVPYFSCIAIYIFLCNTIGLIGLESPTSNLSITLALGLVTVTMTQLTALKTKGAFQYIKGLLIPPTNILGAISPLVSLSVRLFGNILSGGILTGLIYAFTGWLSSLIFGFIPIDIIGPPIMAVLHAYFDLFAGFLQTFIFVTLSSVYISMEVE